MASKYIEILTCDRCKEEFNRRESDGYGQTVTISDLYYMVLKNGSGSQNSNMKLDLCPRCTERFLNFMRDGRD